MLSLELNLEVERAGLTEKQLQTDVELQLRQMGIPILTITEAEKASGYPSLVALVNALRSSLPNLYAFTVSVDVLQNVSLEREPAWRFRASTWETRSLGLIGHSKLPSELRQSGRDQVAEFINAYLSGNPRPAPAGTAVPPPASPRRDLVRQVQARLQSAGFNPGTIDGTMGPQTRDALRGFQNTKGLRPTGEPDEATLDALGVR